MLWQERLDEALHRIAHLEQLRTEEANRTDAIMKQMKVELSEAVRLEELATARADVSSKEATEEKAWREKEQTRADQLQRELTLVGAPQTCVCCCLCLMLPVPHVACASCCLCAICLCVMLRHAFRPILCRSRVLLS